MPGRPFPYTKKSSWSGSETTKSPVKTTFGWLLIPTFPPLPTLTLAGFAVAAEAEAGAAAAGPGFVAVAQQADIGATSSLPELIRGASVAAH